MQFSFVVSAAAGNDSRIETIVDSIEAQGIKPVDYEIIIVGGGINIRKRECVSVIDFDESVRPAWITRKKNLGAQAAKFENLVIMHDYIALDEGWYDGFSNWMNADWSLAITPLYTTEGARWRDYTLFPLDLLHSYPSFGERALLPYTYLPTHRVARHIYVSGAYYIVKRTLALNNPLNEELLWGQGEDLEWCRRLYNKEGTVIKCNPHSSARFVKALKEAAPVWHAEIDKEQLRILKNLG